MAYHKKSRKKKSAPRRRRRVSGIGNNSTLLTIGAAVGGYFVGQKVNDLITTKLPNVDPKLIAAAEVVAGFLLPKYVMKNSMAGKLIGGALMGTGAHLGLKEFGIVSGLPVVNGYRDLRSVAGINNVGQLPYSAAPGTKAPGLTSMQVISGIFDK